MPPRCASWPSGWRNSHPQRGHDGTARFGGTAAAAQRFKWDAYQRDPEAPNLVISLRLRVRGRLDRAALTAALQDAQPALRATFGPGSDGEPVQQIHAGIPVKFDTADVAAVTNPERAAARLSKRAVARPFRLDRPGGLRALLIRLAELDHVLVLCLPGIVVDGWSVAVEVDPAGQQFGEPVVEQVAKSLQFWGFREGLAGESGGLAEGDDQRDVLGPRAEAAFLAAAVHGWFEVESGVDVEGADAFGCVHLVPGHGEQIHAQLAYRYLDLAGGLGGVGVERGSAGVGEVGQFADGLDGAGSPLACMIDTSMVSSVSAASRSPGWTRPCWSTGSTVTRKPNARRSASRVARTAGCSVAWVIRWVRFPPGEWTPS